MSVHRKGTWGNRHFKKLIILCNDGRYDCDQKRSAMSTKGVRTKSIRPHHHAVMAVARHAPAERRVAEEVGGVHVGAVGEQTEGARHLVMEHGPVEWRVTAGVKRVHRRAGRQQPRHARRVLLGSVVQRLAAVPVHRVHLAAVGIFIFIFFMLDIGPRAFKSSCFIFPHTDGNNAPLPNQGSQCVREACYDSQGWHQFNQFYISDSVILFLLTVFILIVFYIGQTVSA